MDNEQQRRDETQDVSVGLDALECPVCWLPFDGSIFQCENGHAVCEACLVGIHGTCPSCRAPVGRIRCRPLENIVAGMVVPCAFRRHGCTQRVKYSERRVHEADCQYAPCVCPFQGCGYSARLLHDHIRDAHADDVVSFAGSRVVVLHRSTAFRVLLNKLDGRVFLLLNGGGVRSGRSLSVVCISPRPAGSRVLEYKLKISGGVCEPGALSLSGPVPFMRSWEGHYPTEGFLFVPDAYWRRSLECVFVTVHVGKSTVVDKVLYNLRKASLEDWMLLVLFFAVVALLLTSLVAWKEKTSHRNASREDWMLLPLFSRFGLATVMLSALFSGFATAMLFSLFSALSARS